jgi:hypothetical protein
MRTSRGGRVASIGWVGIARPLLFPTIDSRDRGRGVPVQALSIAFVIALAIAAAEAAQAIRALPLLGVIAAPAGATARSAAGPVAYGATVRLAAGATGSGRLNAMRSKAATSTEFPNSSIDGDTSTSPARMRPSASRVSSSSEVSAIA